MTPVEIDQRVKAVVIGYLHVLPNEIRPEARLDGDTLGLGRAEIIEDLQDELGITISTEEENGIKTVQDLIACVNLKMSVKVPSR